MLRQIVINGVPAGVQNSIISVANIFVQAHINTFGATAVAAAVLIPRSKASDFFRLPALLWHLPRLSARTWAQGEYERARKGAVIGAVCSLSIADW